MKRIANRDGSDYTSELKEFKGSNTYAENSDKYSVSTSKHMGQLRPNYGNKMIVYLDTKHINFQINRLVNGNL